MQLILIMFIIFSKFLNSSEYIKEEMTEEEKEEINNIIMPTFTKSEITQDIYRRIYNVSYKENENISLEELNYLRITYYDYEGNKHIGEMIVNAKIADEVLEIFKELYDVKYPIYQMKLVDEYNGSDYDSIEANNTSSFNYRYIENTTTLSNHAFGLAIDINPIENPYVLDGNVEHAKSEEYINRSKFKIGMVTPDDECVKIFKKYGWTWGGDWINPKDYQHFEKEIN